MTEQAESELIVQLEDNVLWLRINRPSLGNTLNEYVRDELVRQFKDADANPDVRAIVVTGSGRHFCTGADIGGMTKRAEEAAATAATPPRARGPLDTRRGVATFQELARVVWFCEKPVVSAINGTVGGAGLPLALGADIVVAAAGAQFRSIFAEGGMIPHAGDPWVLARVFPIHRLMEFAMLRERYTAEDMLAWNVINFVVPADELEAKARALAVRLATGPTLTLGQTKRIYRRSLEADVTTVMMDEAMTVAAVSMTRDRQEGIKALIERRPTEFTGE